MAKISMFNDNIAKKYGITEAIILNQMVFYIEKNIANRKKFIDGNYWIYNSKKAWLELLPYMTEHSLKTALNNLIKKGAIITGRYNKINYDRTLWYAIKDYSIFKEYDIDIEKAISEGIPDEEYNSENSPNALVESVQSNSGKHPIERLKVSNRLVETGQPIPVISQYNNHYTSSSNIISREREKNNLDFDKNNNSEYDEETGYYKYTNNKNSNNNSSFGYSKQDAYFEFEKSIVVSYAKLTGKPISELRQINDFKTFEKREMLEQAFNNRKLEDWQKAIDLSLDSVANADYKYKWFNFINAVYYNLSSITEKPKSEVSAFEKMQLRCGKNWREIHAAMSEKFGEHWYEEQEPEKFLEIDDYLFRLKYPEIAANFKDYQAERTTTEDDWDREENEKFLAEYSKEHDPVDTSLPSWLEPLFDEDDFAIWLKNHNGGAMATEGL